MCLCCRRGGCRSCSSWRASTLSCTTPPAILELAGIHDNRLALLVRPLRVLLSAAAMHEATLASACGLWTRAIAVGVMRRCMLQVALAPAGVNAVGHGGRHAARGTAAAEGEYDSSNFPKLPAAQGDT